MRSAESSLASGESNTKNNQSRIDHVWLSLSCSDTSLSLSLSPSSPPKSYQCSLCSRRFRSVQALGGHQNAHRKEKNAMHKMYIQILTNLKQQEQHLPPPPCPLPHHSTTAHATSSLLNISPLLPDDHHQPKIDLDLGLRCGSSSPKFKYYRVHIS